MDSRHRYVNVDSKSVALSMTCCAWPAVEVGASPGGGEGNAF